MSVDEELVPPRVPEPLTLRRIAEQRPGKTLECPALRLEALPADVDDDPLAASRRALVLVADVGRRDGGWPRRPGRNGERDEAERREPDRLDDVEGGRGDGVLR